MWMSVHADPELRTPYNEIVITSPLPDIDFALLYQLNIFLNTIKYTKDGLNNNSLNKDENVLKIVVDIVSELYWLISQ